MRAHETRDRVRVGVADVHIRAHDDERASLRSLGQLGPVDRAWQHGRRQRQRGDERHAAGDPAAQRQRGEDRQRRRRGDVGREGHCPDERMVDVEAEGAHDGPGDPWRGEGRGDETTERGTWPAHRSLQAALEDRAQQQREHHDHSADGEDAQQEAERGLLRFPRRTHGPLAAR